MKVTSKIISKLLEMVLARKQVSSSNESVAETLIRLLKNEETMAYLFCTSSYDEANQLVRVRRKRKNKVN